MKTKMLRIVSLMLVLMLCITALPLTALTASAASWPSVSSSSYIEFTASKWMPVYRYSSCQTRGTSSPAKSYSSACIDAGDKCYIYKITSSYALVNYPAGSTRKTGYVKRSDLLGVSNPTGTAVSKAKIYTASKAGGSKNYGYIAVKDRVWYCGVSGNWVAVIYQAKSGSRAYKLGWITTDDVYTLNGISRNSNSSNASKLVNVAKAEIGYQGTNSRGYGQGDNTKYGIFTGTNNQPWCAAFVAWCANKSGISTSIIPKSASCENMANWSNSYVRWSSNALSSLQAGDVIFFSSGSIDGRKRHVGIVTAVSGNRVTVLEGNTGSDVVKENTYTVNTNGYINQRWSYAGVTYNMYFGGYINI